MRRHRLLMCAAAAAGLVAGCGGSDEPSGAPANATAKPSAPALIVFRRVRYEGATMRILTLRRDGTFDVKIPNGGAGGSSFDGRVKPGTLAAVRRQIDAVPWSHLTTRKATYDRSGAYFMLRHAGEEHVAMSAGMSADLLPLVSKLNGVLNGEGVAEKRVDHRFYTP